MYSIILHIFEGPQHRLAVRLNSRIVLGGIILKVWWHF